MTGGLGLALLGSFHPALEAPRLGLKQNTVQFTSLGKT